MHALMRKAAEYGPGCRGRKRRPTEEERGDLAHAIREAGGSPPVYLERKTDWVEHPAKLFQAGDYPDKGVRVTSGDLEAMVDGFELPVPILIEHAESPLEIGFLTDIERVGEELLGTLAITYEADALVKRSGAKALSLGVTPDLRQIREVSLVRHPRIADAGFLSFSGDVLESEPATFSRPAYDAERQIEDWTRQGRLTPAQAPFVRALLNAGDTVEFDGSKRPLRQLVQALFERQPPHALFSELIPAANAEASEHLLLPEEAAFYRKHFPDVSLSEIVARKMR